MTKNQFSYYDFGRLLSHNAVINMVMGARGLGKTYGAKRLAIRNAIKRGEQFIYLRRYRTELKGRFSFFADIAHEFPEYEFRVNGNNAELRVEGDKEWQTIGYFISLSTSQTNKSVAFPKVTLIIYDEFIIEKGAIHYLPNEVNMLYDFYSTVDRYQDKTRVLMLSNAISITNPYFIEYNMLPNKEFVTYGDGFVCAHFVDSEQFASEVEKTRFGSFITNHAENYADYAISNEFRDADMEFIGRKSGRAHYSFTIRTNKGHFSVWIDGDTCCIQRARPRGDEVLYTLTSVGMREGETLLVYGDKIMQYLRRHFKNGRMVFDDPNTRNIFREIFSRLISILLRLLLVLHHPRFLLFFGLVLK